MRCEECNGSLETILERSRGFCAMCYLRHLFEAEHRPQTMPTKCPRRDGDQEDVALVVRSGLAKWLVGHADRAE